MKQRMQPISISLPQELLTELDELAKKELRPRSNYIHHILRLHLQEVNGTQHKQNPSASRSHIGLSMKKPAEKQ